MAAIGVFLEQESIFSRLLSTGLEGATPLLRIPDPKRLSDSLHPSAKAPFRIWKNIRGGRRRSRAVTKLLEACRDGYCFFSSHSTLSQFTEGLTDNYIRETANAFVKKDLRIGHPEYSVNCAPFGPIVSVSRQRLVSLNWVAHCLRVFRQKYIESFGDLEVLFIHDNLPFDRPEDIAVVRVLLNALSPGRVHFMTERNEFEFAPADNLAAATHAFITGRDSTIQQWIWKNERPKNFYMTADEGNGAFTRYI